jgi:hypothetical protein
LPAARVSDSATSATFVPPGDTARGDRIPSASAPYHSFPSNPSIEIRVRPFTVTTVARPDPS